MSQKNKIIISIAFPILGLLIIAVIAATFIMSSTSTANPPELRHLYNDGTLQTGRYYLNGDKESFYYEVFDDQTIQLGGGNPEEFVLLFNGVSLEEANDPNKYDERFWEGVRDDAKWRSTRRNYVVLQYNWSETHSSVHVMLDSKSVEDVNTLGGGLALRHIDEKTLCPGGERGFKFIRTD
ncbi:MAG: hypothetical protein LBC82_03120 [Oscillospiraceae bacterium]|jgi:hypothetical protein|nr:hypothetical protein [Oscillospiraceae bacterium]